MDFRRTASFLLATAIVAAPWPALSAAPAPAEGQNGMVVTAQHIATDVGVDVLKSGGSAVDAAGAVGYALAVTYPTAGILIGGRTVKEIESGDAPARYYGAIDSRATAGSAKGY